MRLLSRLLYSEWASPTSPPISTSTDDDFLEAMRWKDLEIRTGEPVELPADYGRLRAFLLDTPGRTD